MSLFIFNGTSRSENANGVTFGSDFSVTIAIAAAASDGLMTGHPLQPPYDIEPLTSIPSKYLLFVGSTNWIKQRKT